MMDTNVIPKLNRQLFEEELKRRAIHSLEKKAFYEGLMAAYEYVLSQMQYTNWSDEE